MELKERVKKVNGTLKAGEPTNYKSDHKGYTGYVPQHVIDAVNMEFLGEWSMTVEEKKNFIEKNKKGESVTVAFVHVRVTLCGQPIDAMASHPNVQGDLGDAFKAAQTDAMKKAFAHFSIGNRAYHGLLK